MNGRTGVEKEVALGAVTVAAVLGLVRLFNDAAFLVPALGAAAASHAVAAVVRRRGVAPLPAAGLSAAALGVVVTLGLLRGTTTFGIPGPATLRALAEQLADAWNRFGDVVAPTPATPGFVLATVLTTWAAATVADFFAFRVRTRFEALVPSFTIFLFGALLGADGRRVEATVLYLAAVLAFLALTEARAPGPAPWRPAAALGVVTVVAAAVAGPRLPGAGGPELVAWRDRSGAARGDRITVSPLVDIRGRLVDPSDTALFNVRSTSPAYWRLTALDLFDGTIWSSRAGYRAVREELPPSGDVARSSTPLHQEFELGQLASIWLPAAFRPDRIATVSAGGTDVAMRVSFDPTSSSLVSSRPDAGGLRYAVDSDVPRLTSSALASAASGPPPAALAERNLELPDAFGADVVRLARQVVAGRERGYAQARALQDWFRREFTYSLEVPAGHGNDAIRRFLFETRTGYCEQFAGSYAAMARALGLPARVAVGFTTGLASGDGAYRVRAKDAHAWPEVYLPGAGWVAFEPTPGRGMPGAEGYTGVRAPPPAGMPEEEGVVAPPVEEPGDTVPTTVVEPAPGPQDPETSVPPTTVTGGAPEPAPVMGGGQRRAIGTWLLLALAGLGLAAPGVVSAVRIRRRQARRSAADSPASRVLVAWAEATEVLTLAGVGRHAWETPAEYARRAGTTLGPAAPALEDLAGAVAVATYRDGAVEPALAEEAVTSSTAVTRQVAASAGRVRWALWSVDPRPLWRSGEDRPPSGRPGSGSRDGGYGSRWKRRRTRLPAAPR